MQLFHGLGEYEHQTVFLPRIDKVDMQAGNWLLQLEALISKAPNFVPCLTPDYREGPIARQEIDLALRRTFHASLERRLVPVLIAGTIQEYEGTFLGGYQIYDARGEHCTPEHINDIAGLLLATSRNPYE